MGTLTIAKRNKQINLSAVLSAILILAIEQRMSLTRLAVAMGLSFQTVSRWRKDFARGANQIHLTSPPARTRGFSTIVQPLFDRLKREPHGHPNKIHVL